MPGVPARRPPGRLGSLKGPPATRRPRAPPKATEAEKKCTNCGSTDLEENDGAIVCQNCYSQVAEANIVAEVTFEESAGGRATVQGGTVNENARHAKTLGPQAFRRVGGGERASVSDVQAAGKRALIGLCPRLGIDGNVQEQATNVWNLAATANFSAGRKTDEVVAACLYIACRKQKENKILLMDIAELLQINVFRLGEVYKDMCKELYLDNMTNGEQRIQELEPLIKKYCDKLQFADKTKVVAEDALKIIRRMNRDWIVAGRHPAGLCGACIILAARMNNFQRSVREVVYVSKVADVTIAKRVEEFRLTRSSTLTVDLFREYANRIKHQHDPPASFSASEKERLLNNRKRKRDEHVRLTTLARESRERDERAALLGQSEQPIEIPDDATDASSRLSSVESETPMSDEMREHMARQKRLKVDHQTGSPAPPVMQQAQSEPVARPSALQPTPPTTQNAAKRKRDNSEGVEPAGIDNNEGPNKRQRTSSSPATDNGSAQPERRVDSDGFAIPSLPASAAPMVPVVPAMAGSGAPITTNTANSDAGELEAEEEAPKRRGRRKKDEFLPPPIDISREELDVEDYLEKEIDKWIEHREVEEARTDVQKKKAEEEHDKKVEAAAVVAAAQAKVALEQQREERQARGQSTHDSDEEDLDKLFENDREVEHCILKPHEVKIKEQIWVAHNEDWLRKQAEKEMMAAIAKQNGTSTRGRKSKKGDKVGKTRKKRSKMGDGTVLTEASTPVETPADAARLMMEKRAPQRSQFVDFSVLGQIYKKDSPSQSGSSQNTSGTQTRQVTPTGSVQATSPAPSQPATESDAHDGASQQADSPSDEGDDENAQEEGEETRPVNDWETFNQNPLQDEDVEEGDEMYDDMMESIEQQPQDEFGAVPDDDFSGSEYEYE